MSAEEWLRVAIDRALEVGDPARYPELTGAVEALTAAGVLPASAAQAARDRLDEAFAPGAGRADPFGHPLPGAVGADPFGRPLPGAGDADPFGRPLAGAGGADPFGQPLASPGFGPPGELAPPPPEKLVAVLAPAVTLTKLGEADVVLMAVELWTNVVIVRLATAGGRPPAPRGVTVWGAWVPEPRPERPTDGQVPAGSADVPPRDADVPPRDADVPPRGADVPPRDADAPPLPPELLAQRRSLAALLHVPLALTDDVGTRYVTRRGHASGDPPLRSEHTFEPAVPAAARRLVVSAAADGAQRGGSVALELPG